MEQRIVTLAEVLDRAQQMNTKRHTVQTLIEKFKGVHGDKYGYEAFTEYIDVYQKIQILCRACSSLDTPYVFHQQVRCHLKGAGCKKCATMAVAQKRKVSFQEFKEQALAIHGDAFDYSEAETCYKNYSETIPIKCNTCSRVFMQIPACHAKGVGCKMCQAKITGQRLSQRAAETFIDKMKAIHGEDDIGYDLVEYKTTETPVKLFCKRCNEVYLQKPMHSLLGSKCQRCKRKSELKLFRFLKDIYPGICISEQVHFTDLKDRGYLYFDFQLQTDKHRVIIELDGKQHFGPISVFGGEEAYQQGKRRDEIKEQYLRDHQIPLIRIYQPDVWSDKGDWQKHLDAAIKNTFSENPVMYATIGSVYMQ